MICLGCHGVRCARNDVNPVAANIRGAAGERHGKGLWLVGKKGKADDLYRGSMQSPWFRGVYCILAGLACPVHYRFLPARNSDRNVSVRLSVTRRYCVKTKKASVMISSPSGSPKTLVFWRQISSPNSKGFPPIGGLKQGSVGKIQRFSTFKCQYLENGSR